MLRGRKFASLLRREFKKNSTSLFKICIKFNKISYTAIITKMKYRNSCGREDVFVQYNYKELLGSSGKAPLHGLPIL